MGIGLTVKSSFGAELRQKKKKKKNEKKGLSHSDCNLPLPAPTEGGQERSSTPEASVRGHWPLSPSRSGKVATIPPHGLGSCLCFGTEGLTCTIEMILVSTVLSEDCWPSFIKPRLYLTLVGFAVRNKCIHMAMNNVKCAIIVAMNNDRTELATSFPRKLGGWGVGNKARDTPCHGLSHR